MYTLTLLVLDVWSTLTKLNLSSCKFSPSHEMSELRNYSEMHKRLTLLLEMEPCKVLISRSCGDGY